MKIEEVKDIEIEEDLDDELPPDPSRIINGLRDTGYEFETAIADIVDNSITANATKVDITINLTLDNEIVVYIADNGTGMDKAGLRNAAKYGSEQSYEKNSLSKFGLGLKTGSTAFCRCLSIMSRWNDGIVRKIQWDLDYVAKINKWKPIACSPLDDEVYLLDTVAEGSTGTLIIWEKVDRLLFKSLEEYKDRKRVQNAIKNKKERLKRHLGLTFQRFIDKNDDRARNVVICIDGSPIDAIDPFCLNENDTIKYLPPKPLRIQIEGEEKRSVGLTAYVLPRSENIMDPKTKENAQLTVHNQGFYIYRNNRLIHYGDWLGMYLNETHENLCRVDFSFDEGLDDVFNVDIKKSKILPAQEILDWMDTNFLSAPRRAANQRSRKGTQETVIKDTEQTDAHGPANRTIDEIAPKVQQSEMTPIGDNLVSLENKYGKTNHRIKILSDSREGQVRIIPVESIDDGLLWQPVLTKEGKHAVEINMSHPYYQKVYYPVIGQSVMVTGMDALLWALGEAENSNSNDSTREYYEDIRLYTSSILRKLIINLPDPETEE